MMNDTELLWSIVRSCDLIDGYISGMTYDDFVGNGMVASGCAGRCMAIGNLCHRVSDETKGPHPEVDWHGAYEIRCRIVDGFDTPAFDLAVLWSFITDDMPKLRAGCERILEENGIDLPRRG